MTFAFLFGLSMDYEVFILSRMREEYDRTGSTELAVVRGIGRTGRLVTSAALILFLAFTAMASGPGTDLKMFATGLATGILVDATVIRALVVPAVILLMGRWNWWLPHAPARLLRVEPSLPPCGAERGELSRWGSGAPLVAGATTGLRSPEIPPVTRRWLTPGIPGQAGRWCS